MSEPKFKGWSCSRKWLSGFQCCAPGEKKQEIGYRCVIPNHLTDNQLRNPNRGFKNNRIRTTKYSLLTFLPKNLLEQFRRIANLYFIFMVILNWIPQIEVFGKEISMIPVLFVMAVTAVKDAFEDFRRFRADQKINNSTCRVWNVTDKMYRKTAWKHVMVGDLVHLSCNEKIPADLLLLSSSDSLGVCYIETSNLDGESNLKQRQIVTCMQPADYFFDKNLSAMFRCQIQCENPNAALYKFNGFLLHEDGTKEAVNNNNLLLRGCELRNTDCVKGVVIYTGHDTKLMMNNGGLRYKRSGLERLMNWDVLFCMLILVGLCLLGGVGSTLWLKSFDDPYNIAFFIFTEDEMTPQPILRGFITFWALLIVLQNMIPLSLYVSVEMIKLGQVYFISRDNELSDPQTGKKMQCRALNIPEELGQIQYIMSDKTGTLTENQMIFRRCCISGIDYGDQALDEQEELKPETVPLLGLSGFQRVEDVKPSSELLNIIHNFSPEVYRYRKANETNSDYECREILDFFISMMVCNTVVVSAHPHVDLMNSTGTYEGFYLDVFTDTTLSNSSSGTLVSKPKVKSTGGLQINQSKETLNSVELPLNPIYEAESPDELALVHAAAAYKFKLRKRDQKCSIVELPNGKTKRFKILHVLPFDPIRKRMSVIVKSFASPNLVLYCKGADSAIMNLLSKKYIKSKCGKINICKTQSYLGLYGTSGLRTLCVAKRELSKEEYCEWLRLHLEAESAILGRDELLYQSAERIETNMVLLGVTGVEDRLQHLVPETIASLRQAHIKIWVLTGDKIETAINIAYACKLFPIDMELIQLSARTEVEASDQIEQNIRLLAERSRRKNLKNSLTGDKNLIGMVIDGRTLAYCLRPGARKLPTAEIKPGDDPHTRLEASTVDYDLRSRNEEQLIQLISQCISVLCCRATPSQKSHMVKLVKYQLHGKTLAIGDGANDVAMIQAADVGVGICGQEGMQAVMASDFALARFHFLKRLLLVHGHWCYDRLARTILYFFYKNSVVVFTLFWYQFFCGFSSQSTIDPLYLMLYNLIFTSLPPLIFGVFDQDATAKLLMDQPKLYSVGRKGSLYKSYSFWLNILDALWQSAVVYFVTYLMYSDSDIGMWSFGFLIFSALVLVNQLHLAVEVRSWTWLLVSSIIFSVTIYYCFFALLYSALVSAKVPVENPPYWVAQRMMATPLYWLTLTYICILTVMPRLTVKILVNSLAPSEVLLASRRVRFQQLLTQKGLSVPGND